MSRLRLALLVASFEPAETRRNFRRELDADLVEFAVTDGQLPPPFPDDAGAPAPEPSFDGIVVTGSSASAYDDEAWIEETRAWVRTAHEHGLPVLGVCFGHQLLASALGGRVEAMAADPADDGGFELGYREVERTGRGTALFEDVDDRFTAFTTHGDAVVDLPPDGEVLARNDYGLQAFRVGHAFGVQFHPEYDLEMAESVARRKEFLGDERLEAVLADVTRENYEEACRTKRLFDNFTDYVRQVNAGERDPDAASGGGESVAAGE